MNPKCAICKNSCKESSLDCKFYPQDTALGYETHFKDPNYKKHESTSRMCVVCKDYFNLNKIRWIRQDEGLYSMCLECARTHDFILVYAHR